MAGTITFTKHKDGTVTVDGFPDKIEIDHALLTNDPARIGYMTIKSQNEIAINVANGKATYTRVMEMHTRPATLFAKVHSEIDIEWEPVPAWKKAIWG